MKKSIQITNERMLQAHQDELTNLEMCSLFGVCQNTITKYRKLYGLKAVRKNKHGQSRRSGWSLEYQCWKAIKNRCYRPAFKQYHNYGGRGITMCDRWFSSFENFYTDMGPKPSPKYSIDRIDVDGNYEPANCRWATMKEQCQNMRPLKENVHGKLTFAQIAEILEYTKSVPYIRGTQRKLARKYNVTPSTICGIFKGRSLKSYLGRPETPLVQ